MWKKGFRKKIVVLFMSSMVFGGSLWGDLYTENLGFGFVEKNKEFFNISQEESTAIKTVTYYEQAQKEDLILNEKIKTTINTIKNNDVSIGKVKLSDLLKETESFSKKAELFDNAFVGMNKVLEKVSVNENNIQGTIDNLNIGQRIDNMNSKNENGGTTKQLFLNSVTKQWKLVKQSTIDGYKISRATFLRIPYESKLTEIQKSTDVAKNVVFVAQAMERFKNILMLSDNDLSSGEKVSSLIAEISSLANEANSGLGTAGAALSDAVKLTTLIKNKQNLESINTEDLSNSSSDVIKTYSKSIENDMFLTVMSLLTNAIKSIPTSSPYDFAEVGNILGTMIGQTDKIMTENSITNLYTNSKNLNNDFDTILKDSKDIVSSFYSELGTELKNNPSLEDNLLNPNKEKLAQLEKKEGKLNSKIGDINEKESDIKDKKAKLNNLNNQLNNFNNSSSKAEIDSKKFAFLVQAKELVEKYGNIPLNQWDNKDRVKLGILAKNLDIGFGDGIIGKATYLRTQLRLGKFSYLRDTFATNIIEVSNYNNYSSIEKEIQLLTQEIKKENQELTLLKLDKNKLEIETSNLTDDYNNDFKKEIAHNTTKTSTHESWWSGNYTKVFYGENHLGEPSFGGYGDGEAETKEYKPTAGTKLYLNEIDNEGNTVKTLTSSESSYFGSYDYVAWGTWSDSTAINQVYTSHWVVVDQLDRDQIPKQGSATYKGELAGGQWNIGETGYNSVNGVITLNANFGTNNISGNLNVKNASNNSTWATASFNSSMSSGSDGDGLSFKGNLTGAGISNQETWHSQINGSFGGNQAAEVGGVWAITKGTGSNGDGQAVGVFRAKKQ
jgi:hypothetical protein